MSGQGELRIDAVSRTFHVGGEKLLALDRVSLTVTPGALLTIAGPERFQMDLVMLGILIPGLVGFLINRGASAIEARLLCWRVA